MYFLIVYDRGTGEKVDMLTFASDREEEARDERFRLELSFHRKGADVEVVLLQADDEQALRHTHRRYFTGARALSDRMEEELTKVAV